MLFSILQDGQGHIDLNHLQNQYGIKVTEYIDRYVLNYDQINSSSFKFHPVVRVCRQLILSKDLKRILHRSFDRFFNYGEDDISTAEFDISQAICDEKLDGSLIGVYFDGERWRTCSRLMAYAEGPLPKNTANYSTFEELIRCEVDLKPIYHYGDYDCSYLFELVSPYNRNVTKYFKTRMVLLAVRNKITGQYLDREIEAKRIGWKHLPKTYQFSSFDEILQSMKDLHVLEEGYVCCSGDQRIKIKNPIYVAISHLRDNGTLNPKRIIKIVESYEEEEYLAYYPEDRKFFEKYIEVRDFLPRFFEDQYQKVKDLKTPKEFALAIEDIPFKSILFKMRQTEKSASEIIKDLPEKPKVSLYQHFTHI